MKLKLPKRLAKGVFPKKEKVDFDGWCVKKPNGNLNVNTFKPTQGECWGEGFCTMDEAFRTKYWKKWEQSIRAARKLGYVMVKVVVMEV